jgi:hypothetical protein
VAVPAVERTDLAVVQAEPAPPEKPLPWQMAEASPDPVAPQLQAQVETPQPAAMSIAAEEPAAAASTQPAAAVTSAVANAGKAAGAFFGNLFSGDSKAASVPEPTPEEAPNEPQAVQVARIETASIEPPEAPTTTVWTAQTDAAPPPAPPAAVAIAPPQADTAVAASPVAVAEVKPTEPAAPAAPMLPGPFRLQISGENSLADAEKIRDRLLATHASSLNGRDPVIEEPHTGSVLFGSTGAAYRVSLGPYTTRVEAGRLCNILTPHGFDCKVVAVAPPS